MKPSVKITFWVHPFVTTHIIWIYVILYFRIPFRVAMAVIVLIFLTTNVSSAILIHHQRQNYHSLPLYILVIRVSINGTLFLLAAIVLSVCIYKMRTMSSSNVILEAKVYIYSALWFLQSTCIYSFAQGRSYFTGTCFRVFCREQHYVSHWLSPV